MFTDSGIYWTPVSAKLFSNSDNTFTQIVHARASIIIHILLELS